MNFEQKHLLRMAALVIFLIFIYTFIKLLAPGVSFFVLSIILLGMIFYLEYSHIVIFRPLDLELGKLEYIGEILKNEKEILKKKREKLFKKKNEK